MGNHEFCEDCHENNFHHGRPCRPELRAKVVAAEEISKAERKRGFVLLEELQKELNNRGIYTTVSYANSYDTLSITGFSLARAEKRLG